MRKKKPSEARGRNSLDRHKKHNRLPTGWPVRARSRREPFGAGGANDQSYNPSITLQALINTMHPTQHMKTRFIGIRCNIIDFISTGTISPISIVGAHLVYGSPYFQANCNIYTKTSAEVVVDLRKFLKFFSLQTAYRPIGV